MDLMTVREVSETLEISVGRVHQLINAGRLPAVKLGYQFVIKKADLKRIEERKPGRPKTKRSK